LFFIHLFVCLSLLFILVDLFALVESLIKSDVKKKDILFAEMSVVV